MKTTFLISLFLFQLSSYGQSFKESEKKLNQLSNTRDYWENQKYENNDNLDALDPYDSLALYNDKFEKLLFEVVSKFPESMAAKFETLQKNRIRILTSADGNFRIYDWDTNEGGTMHFFKNIIQYRSNGKIKAKIFNTESDDPGCTFYELDQVTSQKKHFYLTCSVVIGSTAAYYYEAKIFSIDNGVLNEQAKLIKTKTGLKNAVGYDIDISYGSTKDNAYYADKKIEPRDYMDLEYDKKSKTLTLPLVTENGTVTIKKIKYRFNGTYFEKLKPKK